jgi:hypothetical protein
LRKPSAQALNDIDETDFVDMFLEDEDQSSLDTLSDFYVLVNFRPAITRMNSRMDCGVAGYDKHLRIAFLLSDPVPVRRLHIPALGTAWH